MEVTPGKGRATVGSLLANTSTLEKRGIEANRSGCLVEESMSEYDLAEPKMKFSELFAAMKSLCGDAPENLEHLVESDESARELCRRLVSSAEVIQLELDRRRTQPGYLTATMNDLRDYTVRYEPVMPKLFCSGNPHGGFWQEMQRAGEEWAQWHQENLGLGDELYAKDLDRAIGFHDFAGAARRWGLLGHVALPTNLATSDERAEKLMLVRNLKQAQIAIVFDAPHAALALLRAVMDYALTNCYGVDGTDLKARINNAAPRLPDDVGKIELHNLRLKANAVLHPKKNGLSETDRRYVESIPDREVSTFENDMIRYFRQVSRLIEGIP